MSTTHIPGALRSQVGERAGERCEYSLFPESISWAAHTIDHIIAEKHGGSTTFDNLAYACALCNFRKGSDLASIDERTGLIVRLYHPRRDHWNDHFQIIGGRIEPRTSIGRVTVRLLRLNDAGRVQERTLLVAASVLRQPSE